MVCLHPKSLLLLLASLACVSVAFGQPSITTYSQGLTGTPGAIALGPDGACWFVENPGNRIGRITPAGVIQEYVPPNAASLLRGIALGPDGALWFTEDDRIGARRFR